MKLLITIFCLLVCNALGSFESAHATQSPAPFSISYDGAGLKTISIENDKLHYVWFTMRKPRNGNPQLPRQTLTDYDRHEATIWLTEKEEEKLRQWVTLHKVFSFASQYPSASGGKSYGAAFERSLVVTQDKRKSSVQWVGDSQPPKSLPKAIDALLLLVENIEKDRRE